MDNEQIAKIVLSIILDKKVVSLQSKPQETPIIENGTEKVSRFDFKAVIQTETGEHKNIIIELQKYKNFNTSGRFREYIGENYMKEETIIDANGVERKVYLPIIAIYIFGYKISKIEALALKAEIKLIDYIWQTPVNETITEIELFTHPVFILQTTAKPKKEKGTRIEKFLKLFVQKLQGEEKNFIIEIEDELQNDPEIKQVVQHLNNATSDKTVVRKLKLESDYEGSIKSMEAQLAETKKQREEAKAREKEAKAREKEERRLKEEERRQKEEAKAREAEERQQKEEERRLKEEAKAKLHSTIKKLKISGMEVNEIADITGESVEEILKILKL